VATPAAIETIRAESGGSPVLIEVLGGPGAATNDARLVATVGDQTKVAPLYEGSPRLISTQSIARATVVHRGKGAWRGAAAGVLLGIASGIAVAAWPRRQCADCYELGRGEAGTVAGVIVGVPAAAVGALLGAAIGTRSIYVFGER
jgi:hypothetical protein